MGYLYEFAPFSLDPKFRELATRWCPGPTWPASVHCTARIAPRPWRCRNEGRTLRRGLARPISGGKQPVRADRGSAQGAWHGLERTKPDPNRGPPRLSSRRARARGSDGCYSDGAPTWPVRAGQA